TQLGLLPAIWMNHSWVLVNAALQVKLLPSTTPEKLTGWPAEVWLPSSDWQLVWSVTLLPVKVSEAAPGPGMNTSTAVEPVKLLSVIETVPPAERLSARELALVATTSAIRALLPTKWLIANRLVAVTATPWTWLSANSASTGWPLPES